MAERLREALVLLEAGLDFSDDVEIDFGIVRQQIDLVLARVGGLVRSYQMGKVMREGALVTLAGRPNVGKSSLLNRFLEEERAIVTDIPGTTRDTIEESVNLDGIAVTLVDTAGIRQSGDAVEMAGTRRSQQFIDVAERVLLVVDGARPPVQEDFSVLGVLDRSQGFLVVNKVDLGVHEAWDRVTVNADSVRVSAKTGEGIERLRMRLRGSLLGGVGVSGDVVTHERHLIALRGAQRALFQAVEGLSEAVPAELVAMECRLALDALSGIVGETTADDILDRIFGSFCIGK
jgi:tRNA modification GTPase